MVRFPPCSVHHSVQPVRLRIRGRSCWGAGTSAGITTSQSLAVEVTPLELPDKTVGLVADEDGGGGQSRPPEVSLGAPVEPAGEPFWGTNDNEGRLCSPRMLG